MAAPRLNGITRARLHEQLSYDPEAGLFYWKTARCKNRIKAGSVAGCIFSNGYRYITIEKLSYRACRLAWLYTYGEPIPAEVDHINLNKSDDRLANLRAADASKNQANRGLMKTNTSGKKGVYFNKSRNLWAASITVMGKAIHLGRFVNINDAASAYEAAAIKAWGEFARTE